MALQLAKYQLKTLPFKVRDAWFAVYGDMLYMPDGSSAYSGERLEKRYGTINVKQKLTTRERKRGARFMDSKGNELSADEVWSAFGNTGKVSSALEHINWCASLVGAKDVLALFPKEVKSMRKASKKTKSADEESNEVVTAVEVEEYAPRGSFEEEQVKVEAHRVVNALGMWKPECRDAWLAERLGLVYMPDGRDGWDKTENARNGALFIDSEGEERQFHRVIRG